MKNGKISIIVPVYNTEEYLEKCFDSLLEQTYENWEAVIVDDGSEDGSLDVCQRYAQRDSRFTVIHQENSGVSAARNRALTEATGDYITFADSDDWLDPDALEVIVGHFETDQVDVVVTGYYLNYPTRVMRSPSSQAFAGICDSKELARQLMLVKDSYWGLMCNKSFRRSCIFDEDGNPVLFDTEVHVAEDQLWLLQVYKNAQTGLFDRRPIYHYLQRTTSAAQSVQENEDRLFEAFDTYRRIIQTAIDEYGIEERVAYLRMSILILTWRLEKIYYANHKSFNRYFLENCGPYVSVMMEAPEFSEAQKKRTRRFLRLMRIGFPPKIWRTIVGVKKKRKHFRKVLFSRSKDIVKNLLPLSNAIIFEGYPDYSDNSYWFAKYLAEETDTFKRYKMVWFIPSHEQAVEQLFGVPCHCIALFDDNIIRKAIRYYYRSTAKFIVDCNRACKKRREKQVRVHLCHGAPIKAVTEYGHSLGEKDMLVVPSEYWRSWFSEAMDQPMESVVPTGYPRNDILCRGNMKKIEAFADKKVLIWMPTYRQHARDKRSQAQMEMVLPLGFPILHTVEQFRELDTFLGEQNMIMLLRLHPSQDISSLELSDMNNIWIADEAFLEKHGLNLYELLAMTDGLLTDYSSVYFDYLLTGKPIALTPEDYELYSKTFNIVVDYEKDIAGYRLMNMDDLLAFVRNVSVGNDPGKEEREQMNQRYNTQNNGGASKAVYEEMQRRFGF